MRKGNSTQELIGIKGFTKNGLKVGRTEFILYQVQPTNISVLSPESIDLKIRHLMSVRILVSVLMTTGII